MAYIQLQKDRLPFQYKVLPIVLSLFQRIHEKGHF